MTPVTMNRRLVALGVAAIVALFLIWFFAIRDRGEGGSGTKPGAGKPVAGAKIPVRAGGDTATPDEPITTTADVWNPDPAGDLVLEGQVLGDGDAPVAGAEVVLSSVPPRTTVSDDDGTFSFDKLVARSYSVTAHKADLYGGPVAQKLTGKSPPVVIRLARGATLTVHVRAEADGAPIANATVDLMATIDQSTTTNAEGIATFTGVGSGWVGVVATSPGFAPADTGVYVGSGGQTIEVTVIARKGAAVSGRVVDDKGQPVPKARVVRQDAGRAWSSGALAKLVETTNDKGEFAFAVVPQGSFRFAATHETLAPGVSRPVTVDGVHPVTEVEIVMQPGGVLTGKVVTKDKQPAPYAGVLVAPKDQAPYGSWGGNRRVTADAKGEFSIRALPRSALRVRAESDDAASAIADVDLATTQTATIELVLDVSGMIAGVVVDGQGQPVPEIQVVAVADMLGKGMENFALTGFSSATTDGGGAFTIKGLADGDYQVSAHRRGLTADESFFQKATSAKPGDTNLRLVLPAPGSIKGKLVLAAGGEPKLAMVSLGWRRQTPAVEGVFELTDVEAGTVDVTIRGLEFAEKTVRDVVVKSGAATDVGTITLERGRRLAGTVIDAAGAPVEGAVVRVGRMLYTEGGKAGADDGNVEELFGIRSTTTGADGTFAIVGIPKEAGTVAAEHPTKGRSDALKVAAGTDDPPALKLTLHGFGSIAGTVTEKGQPIQAQVMATPKTGGTQFVAVTSGPDGTFVIDKVAAGTHRLTAMKVGMASMSGSQAVDVVVKPNERVTQNLEIPVGDVTIEVTIKPKAGAQVDAAQVFLFRGVVAAKNAEELTEAFTSGSASTGGMQFWMGTGTVKFDEQLAGRISLCSIPITGDLRDPVFGQRLQKHSDLLAVYCMGVEVKPTPKLQPVTQELPTMNPLPAD
jgi:protocatechuate 3,4-dioxygenase beta subunit